MRLKSRTSGGEARQCYRSVLGTVKYRLDALGRLIEREGPAEACGIWQKHYYYGNEPLPLFSQAEGGGLQAAYVRSPSTGRLLEVYTESEGAFWCVVDGGGEITGLIAFDQSDTPYHFWWYDSQGSVEEEQEGGYPLCSDLWGHDWLWEEEFDLILFTAQSSFYFEQISDPPPPPAPPSRQLYFVVYPNWPDFKRARKEGWYVDLTGIPWYKRFFGWKKKWKTADKKSWRAGKYMASLLRKNNKKVVEIAVNYRLDELKRAIERISKISKEPGACAKFVSFHGHGVPGVQEVTARLKKKSPSGGEIVLNNILDTFTISSWGFNKIRWCHGDGGCEIWYYGCEVAKEEEGKKEEGGKKLLKLTHQLTGCTIHASESMVYFNPLYGYVSFGWTKWPP